ncbi:MAG: hypothetical protein R2713_08970 [Ilumatobacteraceae bacterium]
MKHLPGVRTYVAVDGGMSDNLRPVLYGSGYEASRLIVLWTHVPAAPAWWARPRERRRARVRRRRARRLRAGDLLATPVTGAYGHSMASNYNKLTLPPVVFVRDGDAWGWWCAARTTRTLLRCDLD